MQQPQTSNVGQISADGQFMWDGQQWVPVPRGTRFPTPWTRPMQLGAAGLLAVEAVYYVLITILTLSPDSIRASLRAQGSQIPSGMTEDSFVNLVIAITVGFFVFIALLELLGALGAFLRWRWVFWYVLVLMALGSLDALLNLGNFFSKSSTSMAVAAAAGQELLAIGAVAMFVWMLIGVIMYGPWAMKRPGA